jgi:hypothetical protein
MRSSAYDDPSHTISETPRFSINKPLFISPAPAGRKITAGFSYVQRIGKSASIDVWFPEYLQQELDRLVARGQSLGPDNFPAEWAAVRQFELLQEAGNYKIYDMDATYITRTLMDLTRNMRGGGYRVTVVTLGSYQLEADIAKGADDLAILDQRLQKRIAHMIHMLYLEEQSEAVNKTMDEALASETWDYQSALPHVGVTLGARDLFRPADAPIKKVTETFTVPRFPHMINVAHMNSWLDDGGVKDVEYGQSFARITGKPQPGHYAVTCGHYQFAAGDAGREIEISYTHNASASGAPRSFGASDRKHRLAQQFFGILNVLPQNHIVHDTAVGLQLPESINEHEWIYCAPEDETLMRFNTMLTDLFTPFDGINTATLDGRVEDNQIKGTIQHMRSYGDRLSADSDRFYRGLAKYSM